MSFYDDLLRAINQSATLSPQTKTVAQNFLTTQRPFLEPLGTQTLDDFFQALRNGGGTDALALLATHLDEPALLALLEQTGAEMRPLIDRRAATIEHFNAFVDALGHTGLMLVSQLILGLL
ncbi:MAG: hypothetical protein WCI73_19390 [Phycisphaerae bacterium]